MGRQFGIITSVEGLTAGIVVQSLSFAENVETVEARNTSGQCTDLASYSKSTTLSISGLVDTQQGTLITAGSKLTIGGKDYLVESVTKNESNTDFIRADISARTADSAVIHIIGGSSSNN